MEYEWNGMVVGFENAPQILQKTMNRIFGGIKDKEEEACMDDIIVYGKTIVQHNRVLEEV